VDPEDPLVKSLSRPLRLKLPAFLLRHARENQELVLGLGSDESDWIREQSPAARAHVDALGAQILGILLTNEEPHSALILGGKYAELNYGRDDRELLREVAIASGIILETALLHRRMLAQGRIEQELQTARRIQESLITSTPPTIKGFSMALRLEPALETGGDLLWVKRRPSGKWLAAVGDVSGKGLPAALYMSQATALLKFAAQQDSDFTQLLPALDQTMRNLMGCRDFLTLCLLEWDENGQYSLARAGHPAPFLVKGPHPEDIQELLPKGRGLGLRPAATGTWEICTGRLGPREWIVLYSDGLTEAMGHHGELYGIQRFQHQIQHLWGMGSVRAVCEAVYREVDAFEVQNRDDRTLFILGRDEGQ
jgi:phosphoserine phosphatase RsbU/P